MYQNIPKPSLIVVGTPGYYPLWLHGYDNMMVNMVKNGYEQRHLIALVKIHRFQSTVGGTKRIKQKLGVLCMAT